MVGINSGRRRTRHFQTVERVVALDMRALRRLRFVRDGECVIDIVRWSNARPTPLQARLRVDLSDIDAATVTITVETPGGTIKQCVAINALPCRYGGHRFYFVCPALRHRCEVLYMVDGRWASRRAHGLTYATQSMGDVDRVRRRRQKLQRRLHGEGLTPRPRGQHRYTIAARIRAAVDEERDLQAERLYRMVKAETQRANSKRSGTP